MFENRFRYTKLRTLEYKLELHEDTAINSTQNADIYRYFQSK